MCLWEVLNHCDCVGCTCIYDIHPRRRVRACEGSTFAIRVSGCCLSLCLFVRTRNSKTVAPFQSNFFEVLSVTATRSFSESLRWSGYGVNSLLKVFSAIGEIGPNMTSKYARTSNICYDTRTVISDCLVVIALTWAVQLLWLCLQELFSRCDHYNTTVKQDALTGLHQLLSAYPELTHSHLSPLLSCLAHIFIDKDAAVRASVHRLLRLILPRVSSAQIQPFFFLLTAHLSCAMTHICDDVQVDSLAVLDLLVQFYPTLGVSRFHSTYPIQTNNIINNMYTTLWLWYEI